MARPTPHGCQSEDGMTSIGTTTATIEYDCITYEWAREYARTHGLNLRSVLNAALAEYAARRQQTQTGPEPQLHYGRGHPSAEITRRQRELVVGSKRGRKLREPSEARPQTRGLKECPTALPSRPSG